MKSPCGSGAGRIAVLAAMVCWSAAARAEVRLPAVIGDNMVVQCDRPAQIWGWADAGEAVTMTVGGVTMGPVEGHGQNGEPWRLTLPAMAAGPVGPIVIAGKNTLTLNNVLAGEVWLCSGQSNMAMTMTATAQIRYGGAVNAEQEVAAAGNPNLRLFDDRKGVWEECTPASVATFSACAWYFFGRDLQKMLDRPVGLILSSIGGTRAEPWTPASALAGKPEFQPIYDEIKQFTADYPQLVREQEAKMADWRRRMEAARASGATTPTQPRRLATPDRHPGKPGMYFEERIRPLARYTIRGVAWYQGESNRPLAHAYRRLLPTLIGAWRAAWGQGDFPFLIVQIANFNFPDDAVSAGSPAAELREAQAMTARSVPGCALVVTIDIGEAANIHPRNKQEVGRRLTLAALKLTYGRNVVASGPTYRSVSLEGGKAVVRFDGTEGGLAAGEGGPRGFEVAGADRKFVAATARIEGETVVVSSAQVSEPVAVRYGWANAPVCTLKNGEGLPAGPFRSDEWPGVTEAQK